jgi:hypothetical protein
VSPTRTGNNNVLLSFDRSHSLSRTYTFCPDGVLTVFCPSCSLSLLEIADSDAVDLDADLEVSTTRSWLSQCADEFSQSLDYYLPAGSLQFLVSGGQIEDLESQIEALSSTSPSPSPYLTVGEETQDVPPLECVPRGTFSDQAPAISEGIAESFEERPPYSTLSAEAQDIPLCICPFLLFNQVPAASADDPEIVEAQPAAAGQAPPTQPAADVDMPDLPDGTPLTEATLSLFVHPDARPTPLQGFVNCRIDGCSDSIPKRKDTAEYAAHCHTHTAHLSEIELTRCRWSQCRHPEKSTPSGPPLNASNIGAHYVRHFGDIECRQCVGNFARQDAHDRHKKPRSKAGLGDVSTCLERVAEYLKDPTNAIRYNSKATVTAPSKKKQPAKMTKGKKRAASEDEDDEDDEDDEYPEPGPSRSIKRFRGPEDDDNGSAGAGPSNYGRGALTL